MKNIAKPFIRLYLLLFFLVLLTPKYAWSQCVYVPVTHLSGAEQVDCTGVTVTSDGSVTGNNYNGGCGLGPFWVGRNATGSYTFTFSPAISGVKLDVTALDNDFGHLEELIFEVNGSFYPITNPGMIGGCHPPAVIWPPGVIRAQIDTSGSWIEVVIDEDMTSLKVENLWLTGTPMGVIFSLYLCCPDCTTDAGEISSSPLYFCPSDPAVIPMAEQSFLDGDDLLQYILFSDLTDTLGSIIATSNFPEFLFDPASMSSSVTYYVAAIAGNGLNGNVDLNDPCFDISNAVEVEWHPEPTVAFLSDTEALCPGECKAIEVYFTGTPPFQLSGEVTDGTGIIFTFDNTYQDINGILSICLPANTALGTVIVQATELTDAICTCN